MKPIIPPERQNLLNEYSAARHDSFQWYECFETLMYARNSILKQAGDKTFITHEAAQVELLQRAASALGPFIGIAKKHRDDANAVMAAVDAKLSRPIPDPPSAEQMRELGERMNSDPSAVTSNVEGLALVQYRDRQKRETIARTGCCGGTPAEDGVCYGIGRCPNFFVAERCQKFVTGYLEWLDRINEQSGLAAITARLCVPSPVSVSEVSNV